MSNPTNLDSNETMLNTGDIIFGNVTPVKVPEPVVEQVTVEDVEETKLDEDIDSINNTIADLEIQKATFEVPEELALNTGVNSDLLTQMADKLKTMPRHKILQMINSLAHANQLPDHDFSNFGAGSVKSNTEKLNKKLKELKSKRTKLGFKSESSTQFSKGGKKNQPIIVEEPHKTTESITEVAEVVETKVVETIVETNDLEGKKPTKLTKNQKKKLRVKANKSKLSESASNDSNIVASVTESDTRI